MKRLFLYLDILGFTELAKDSARVRTLFSILNGARVHRDSNFRTIAFSDTILAYHLRGDLEKEGLRGELMFLIEFAQELLHRLAGTGIAFRGLITEGEFYHEPLSHMDTFFGQALIDTHNLEKLLPGTGLFLDRDLRNLSIFPTRTLPETTERAVFVYLTQHSISLSPKSPESFYYPLTFPFPEGIIDGTDMEYVLYPEIVHLRDIQRGMAHPVPKVAGKYRTTWAFYVEEFPKLMAAFEGQEVSAEALSGRDWSKARNAFYADRPWLTKGPLAEGWNA